MTLVTTRDLDNQFVWRLQSKRPDLTGDVVSDRLRNYRREREARFRSWDSLIETDEFEAFLQARGKMFCEFDHWGARGAAMEETALGAMMMLCDEAVTRGMQQLHGAHFCNPRHRNIFGAICRLERRRRCGQEPDLRFIDFVSVAEELRGRGQLEEVGGLLFLQSLIEGCPSSANIDFYIGRIIEASRLRHLYFLGHEMIALATQCQARSRRFNAFLRACHYRIERQGWCDFKALLRQLEK